MPYSPLPSRDGIDDTYGDGPLACAIYLGHVAPDSHGVFHDLITQEDAEPNELNEKLEGKLSCRVYVRRACERLRAQGVVKFTDWEDAEGEVLRVGEWCRDLAGKEPVLIVSMVRKVWPWRFQLCRFKWCVLFRVSRSYHCS